MEHRGVVVTAVIEIERGRPAVRSVTVEDRGEVGLQTRDLRDVPLRALVTHAIDTVAMPARLVDGQLVISGSVPVESEKPREAQTHRPPRVDRDTIVRVVERYRAALASGDPRPSVTVGAAMGMSSAKVGTLLRRAHALGLLGQAEWGRAGELTEEGEHEK